MASTTVRAGEEFGRAQKSPSPLKAFATASNAADACANARATSPDRFRDRGTRSGVPFTSKSSSFRMVPATGFEPVWFYPLEPESSASANSATRAQQLTAILIRGNARPGKSNHEPFSVSEDSDSLSGFLSRDADGFHWLPSRRMLTALMMVFLSLELWKTQLATVTPEIFIFPS